MSSSLSINSFGPWLSNIVRRYHVIIFTLTIVVGISVAVFFLNNLISRPSEVNEAPAVNSSFDKETIDRIQNLVSPGQQSTELYFGPGRSNPFAE